MRKIFALLVLCAIVKTAFAGPVIEFDEEDYNFGKIPANRRVSHDFIFRNKGDDTLMVDKVRPSCGCTAAMLTNKIVLPGKEGKIHVEFNSKGFNGRINKTVRVQSNDKKRPSVTLKFTGEIEVELTFNPKTVFISAKEADSAIIKTIEIKNASKKKLSITSAVSSSPAIMISVNKENMPIVIDSGMTYIVTLNVELSDFEKGWKELGKVKISTDSKSNPLLSIPVYMRN